MKTTALHPRLGVEVTDFDLPDEWSPDEIDAIRTLFRRHHLLLFRQPDLDAHRQEALIEALGLVPDEWKDGRRHGFLSTVNTEAPNRGRHSPYLFHADLTWKPDPIAAISLYATVIPDEPAPTIFASGVAAAEHLPDDLRRRLTDQRAVFLIDFSGGDQRYTVETASAGAPRAEQLVLYPDRISGQASLIIDELFMDKLVGWDPAESESVRAAAHEHVYAPSNVYRHDWVVGDLVVWNNIALQHSRPQVPETGERTHRRVSGSHGSGLVHWESTARSHADVRPS